MNDTSKRAVRQWMVEQKARVLAEASNLDGNEVTGVVIDASGAICGLRSQVGMSVALTPTSRRAHQRFIARQRDSSRDY